LLFVHYLLIIHEVLDWECVRKYFIEIMMVFPSDPVTLQTGNLAINQIKIITAPTARDVINGLAQWTENCFVGLLTFNRWQHRSLNLGVFTRSNDPDVVCQYFALLRNLERGGYTALNL
jgi:hypothetical protein